MDWERGFVAGKRSVFIGNCPWLWNNWFELGGGCSPSVPRGEAFPLHWVCRTLDFTPCHHLTPQGAFPDSSSSVSPNLGGAGCTRSRSTSERHSLRVKHLLGLWEKLGQEGSASSPAVPGGAVEVLVLDMVRGCFGAGVVPAQVLGVTTQIPHLGWPIREFQTCAGVRWVQQRGSGGSCAASQEEFSGFVSFPHF